MCIKMTFKFNIEFQEVRSIKGQKLKIILFPLEICLFIGIGKGQVFASAIVLKILVLKKLLPLQYFVLQELHPQNKDLN